MCVSLISASCSALSPPRRRARGRAARRRGRPRRASARRARPRRAPPSRSAASSASITARACSTSASEGVNSSLSAATCAGWIAHLPSKPMSRARSAAAVKPSSTLIPRYGPSIAATSCVRAATRMRVLDRAPRVELRACARGAAERRRQVRVAEDQRVQPRRRGGDLVEAGDARGGLDQRLYADGCATALGGRLDAVQQALDERHVAGALDLRDDDRGRALRERGHRDDVGVAPGRAGRVDAHARAHALPLRLLQRRDDGVAGLVLRRRGDGVLEVDDDLIGAAQRRLGEHRRRRAGHGQA